jgi:hypothetical protein
MAVTFTPSGSAAAGGVQQSYELQIDALLEGQLSDIRNNTIGSYVNETGGVLAYGNAAAYNGAGTVYNSAKTLSADTDTFLGVNVLTYVDETAEDGNSRPGVKDEQAMNVANEGAVAVYVHGAVDTTTAVRVVHTTSGTTYAGRFSAAAIPGNTAVLSNARYLTSTTGDGLVVLELNGPTFSLTGD